MLHLLAESDIQVAQTPPAHSDVVVSAALGCALVLGNPLVFATLDTRAHYCRHGYLRLFWLYHTTAALGRNYRLCITSNLKLIRVNYKTMLTTIAVILLILWLLGFVTSYTLGGFIHVLLVIAVIMILLRLIRGENPIK